MPGVVGPLVLVLQPRQDLPGSTDTLGGRLPELIGDGQQQGDQGLLVFGTYRQHVEADALGGGGIIDDPVSLRLLQRRGDAVFGDRFGLEVHKS